MNVMWPAKHKLDTSQYGHKKKQTNNEKLQMNINKNQTHETVVLFSSIFQLKLYSSVFNLYIYFL